MRLPVTACLALITLSIGCGVECDRELGFQLVGDDGQAICGADTEIEHEGLTARPSPDSSCRYRGGGAGENIIRVQAEGYRPYESVVDRNACSDRVLVLVLEADPNYEVCQNLPECDGSEFEACTGVPPDQRTSKCRDICLNGCCTYGKFGWQVEVFDCVPE